MILSKNKVAFATFQLDYLKNNYIHPTKLCVDVPRRLEIENTLNNLKKAESQLTSKERQLREKEIQLMAREKDLEQQLYVATLDSHDVNTWSGNDVYQWIKQMSLAHNMELMEYADLFLKHHVTGKVLLNLSQDDLNNLGIKSLGHRYELFTEIELLKAHNYRLLNFPPLSQDQKTNVNKGEEFKTLKITLIFGHHIRKGHSSKDHKWKMYIEIDNDDDDDDDNSNDSKNDDNSDKDNDLNILTCIKNVTFNFQGRQSPIKVTHPPYIMEKWHVGMENNQEVECIVNFENKVRKPKSCRHVHKLDTSGTNVGQKLLTLTLNHPQTGPQTTPKLTINTKELKPSQSSPQLQGAWVNRTTFIPITTPEKKGSPDVWASVVAGRRPSFTDQPKPRHVPGTTMTLHAPDSSQYVWPQPGTPQNHSVHLGNTAHRTSPLTKSPSSPGSFGSKGSYQSPGQISPGQAIYPFYQGHPNSQGHLISQSHSQINSNQTLGNLSPGQVFQSNNLPLPGVEEIKEQDAALESSSDSPRSKVTFTLTDSSSSKSTESGFSEHVGKCAETYASVCTKCKHPLDHPDNHSDSDSKSRSRDAHRSETNKGKYLTKSGSDFSDRGRGRGQRGNRYNQGNYNKRGHSSNLNRTDNNRNEHFSKGNSNFRRSDGQFSRRGQRAQSYKYRNYKDRFPDDRVLPGSEPEALRETDRTNVPIRRAVSSPDKTYDYNEIHFKFNDDTNDDGNKSHDVDRKDKTDIQSDFTSKLTLNSNVKFNDRTYVDSSDSDNRERQNQSSNSDVDWTCVDYNRKKNVHNEPKDYYLQRGYNKYHRGGQSQRSRGQGRGFRGRGTGRGRDQNFEHSRPGSQKAFHN
ncbi:hypothetical protein ACF0H5_018460 [Mactra antiquata]